MADITDREAHWEGMLLEEIDQFGQELYDLVEQNRAQLKGKTIANTTTFPATAAGLAVSGEIGQFTERMKHIISQEFRRARIARELGLPTRISDDQRMGMRHTIARDFRTTREHIEGLINHTIEARACVCTIS